MAKKEEKTASSTLPSTLEPTALSKLMDRLLEQRDYAGALALVPVVGESAVRVRASSLLLKVGTALKYGSYRAYDNTSDALGWAEMLLGWGADPFKSEGNPIEAVAKEKYEESFFESTLRGGFWSYAAKLALASPDAKKRAVLAVERLNLTESPDRWQGLTSKAPPRPGTRVQELMINGGEPALTLGFALGLDPNGVVNYQPWVFACKDAASVRAFAKAGFDAGVKNTLGLTLPEACARITQARARQEMQKAAMEAFSTQEKFKKSEDSAPAESAAMDAGRHIMALAPRASWREIERASKAAGVDPRALKDKEGNTMLALSVGSANWALAFDLLQAGADPLAVTGEPPIPIALRALGAESYISMSRLPAHKRQALEKVALEMIDKVNFSWRDVQGRPPLEAFVAAYPARTPGWRTFDRWIEREPIDPDHPLWERVARCGMPLLLVSCAARRDKEPWLTPKLGLLEVLAGEISGRSFLGGPARESNLIYFMKGMGSGASAAPQMSKLCDPAQWEAAIDAMWRAQRSGEKEKAQAMSTNLRAAISLWSKVAAAAEIQAFDIDLMGRALVAGLKNDSEVGTDSSKTAEWVENMGVSLCRERPFEAGSILLDVLSSGHVRAIEIGYAIWQGAKASGADLRIPKVHPIFRTPGAVDEKLANHPMWREIEAAVLARASKTSARMRL